jgi:hypothetical protein
MRIKKLTILVLFLFFLYGCQYHIFDKNQVKVIKYSVPNLGYFCPIFFSRERGFSTAGARYTKGFNKYDFVF